MQAAGTITIAPSNLSATTDLVDYTCSGTGATFGLDHVSKSKISICLPKNGSTVTTSRIEELSQFVIGYVASPGDGVLTNIKVRVSKNGVDWSYPLATSDSISYSSEMVTVTLPRNNYYVKIYSSSGSKNISIVSMIYKQDHCNCFTYEP